MKVLVLTTTFPRWKDDPRPQFVYELSKKYVENGLEVIVLAPHDQGAKKMEIMDGIKVYRFPYFFPYKYQCLAYGGGVWPNFKNSILAKIQAPLLFFTELFFALRIIRSEKINVIHSHWIIPNGLVGAICKRLTGKRHVMTIHGADLFALEKMPFKIPIAEYVLKNTDDIASVSNHLRSKISELLHDKVSVSGKNIYVIPMGIDHNLFSENSENAFLRKKNMPCGTIILLAIGRLVDKKGFPYLIRSMPIILSRYPNTQLIICGDGPLMGELKHLVEDLNLQANISFKGYISQDEKLNYLRMANVLIIPSIVTADNDTEGMPVVLLEGMAAGLPVIATDVGGIKDVVIDGWNGIMIRQKDPDMIAEKVIQLLGDEELAFRLSKNAIDTAKKYDWKVISLAYETLIRGV